MLAYLLSLQDLYQANLAGPAHVSSAAGRAVEVRDLDYPQFRHVVIKAAGSRAGVEPVIGERDRHRPVLPDDPIGVPFEFGGLFMSHRIDVQVDRHRPAAQVETLGRCIKQPQRRLRQNVLSRVVLHMVEPSGPINRALHLPVRLEVPAALHHVQHTILLLEDIGDCGVAQVSNVVRLAPGSRVKRGGSQLDDRFVIFPPDVHDPALKLGQKRVSVVKPLGQDLTRRHA